MTNLNIISSTHSSPASSPTGTPDLHDAIKYRNPQTVQALAQNGADPKQKDSQGITAIEQAVLTGDNQLVSALLQGYFQKCSQEVQDSITQSSPSNKREELKNSLAHFTKIDLNNIADASKAAYKGDLKRLDLSASDINKNDYRGLSPLHYAVLGGSLETVQFLIEQKGANPHLEAAQGNSLLHLAAYRGHEKLIYY